MIDAQPIRDRTHPVRRAARSLGSEASKGYAFVERNWYLTKRYWAWEVSGSSTTW